MCAFFDREQNKTQQYFLLITCSFSVITGLQLPQGKTINNIYNFFLQAFQAAQKMKTCSKKLSKHHP